MRFVFLRNINIWDALTDCQAELEHMDGPFLLQEVHKTEQKVLLFSDFLQFQLQHLMKREGADLDKKLFETQRLDLKTLTDGFLLRASEYFCKKETKGETGSVASSGWRNKHVL